jgi:hypothetical protein
MLRGWEGCLPIQLGLSKATRIIIVTASVASAQTFITLYTFPYANGGPSGVVQGSDGNFYGITVR